MLERRVGHIESDLSQVKKKLRHQEEVQKKEYADQRGELASLNADIDSLKSELKSLLGELESLSYHQQRHIREFEKNRKRQDERFSSLSKNILERLSGLEQYLGFERPLEPAGEIEEALKSSHESVNGKEIVADMSEEPLYRVALRLFEAGEYEEARRTFETLLSNYPDSSLCDNARFWIGESYYREEWYEKAILEYQKAVDDYPQGNKIPAVLLKQGMAFARIDDKTNAGLVLNRLIKSFPDSNEARIAEKKLAEL